MTRMKRFFLCERGAVTVEWVVLTAGVAALASGVGVFVDGPFSTSLERTRSRSLQNAMAATTLPSAATTITVSD
ncbi:hypothetical protein [Acidimangrovimonas sediminis]|uniref:hypothetical protein n=1 Tax=Acidimangrovimonas sediminis TaxID=2056283 RepID=UPI000C80BF41|nr:hypothetical protein [Acidimangrovimonas sediminis]